jgi:hypothetical protein
MRLVLAFRVFFRVLFSAEVAARVGRALEGPEETPAALVEKPSAAKPRVEKPRVEKPRVEKKPAAPAKPARSESLTLLAALQREARFLDIVREPLAQYSDAQIGAAARDVLRDCGAVVERMFGPVAVIDQEEGSAVEVPAGFDPGVYRLTGAVGGEPPHQGQLVHHGWRATRCELPSWSGNPAAAQIIAPAEVELKS